MEAMLDYLVPQLVSAGLKILDVSCARADYFKTSGKVVRRLRPLWPHILLGGASLSRREAEKELSDGWLDLVTWGRHILANPDFAERLRSGRELIPYDAGMLNTLA